MAGEGETISDVDFDAPKDMLPGGYRQVLTKSLVNPESQVDAYDAAIEGAPWTGQLTFDQQDQLRITVADARKLDPREIGVTKRGSDGAWVLYQKTRASVDNNLFTSKAAADAQVATLNMDETGARYEAYASTEPTEANHYRIREKSDYADRVDPDKPIEQEIPLGNGQSVYILSNGRLVTGETDIDWTGWDADDNTHTIGNKEMVELPNGEIVEKSVDAVAADAKPVSTTTLDDGSRVVLFKDGTRQMISGGKVSNVSLDEATGYVVVTDSKGNPSLKKPIFESGIEYTAAGYNILTGPEGPIEDLGLPERPGALRLLVANSLSVALKASLLH